MTYNKFYLKKTYLRHWKVMGAYRQDPISKKRLDQKHPDKEGLKTKRKHCFTLKGAIKYAINQSEKNSEAVMIIYKNTWQYYLINHEGRLFQRMYEQY